jgi:hypothetical protein
MAKFYLLLNKQEESIPLYAKAVQVSKSTWEIETSLRSLERLEIVKDKLPGYDLVRAVLVLALFAKRRDMALLQDCKLKPKQISGDQPVVVVAGGCDAGIEEMMREYRDFLLKTFEGFNGLIISGGTTSGISGLVGEIGIHYGNRIRTIGYVPRKLTTDITIDERYDEIRETDNDRFSYLEPIHYWMDIISSGIKPHDVKVLGINGGRIASFEYKLALALGAKVAIIKNSQGEAEKFESDGDWNNLENIIFLEPDEKNAFDFINSNLK